MSTEEEALLRARRHAPKDLDFDALVAAHRKRNAELVAEWFRNHPGMSAAVLQIRIPASGHIKHRMRRYRELSDFDGRTPGLLLQNYATSFDFLSRKTIEAAAAAARAGVLEVEWRLISAEEALTTSP